jgi:hypothetical protein
MIPKLRTFKSYATWLAKARRHGKVVGDRHGARSAGDISGAGLGEWNGHTGWLSGYLVGVPRAAHRLLTGYRN